MRRRNIGNASLTEQNVSVIKLRLNEGQSPRELATFWEVGLETIRRIDRGDTWWWVAPAMGGLSLESQVDKSLGTGLVIDDAKRRELSDMAQRLMDEQQRVHKPLDYSDAKEIDPYAFLKETQK